MSSVKNSSSGSQSTDNQEDSDSSSEKKKEKSSLDKNKISEKNNGIKEVYEDNFIEEMKIIMSLLKTYNYIGMDTEFPGTVYSLSNITKDFYYKSLKLNVDSLKLIQLGITLTNEKGEFPENIPYHTWQFNFEFDYTKDKFAQSSIDLLKTSGILFNKLKNQGIKYKTFADHFKSFGLVLNPNIYWLSFHGSYDFAYLLKIISGSKLPDDEKEFTNLLKLFFPNHYDIRILVKGKEFLQGSLNRLANYLNIKREGQNHQAGSDSLVTSEVFFKLIKLDLINEKQLIKDKNILFGIGLGEDNKETINYTKIGVNGYYKSYSSGCCGNNMIYLPFRNNFVNFYYPQNMMMNNNVCGYGMQNNFKGYTNVVQSC